jgi:hypothetical protein
MPKQAYRHVCINATKKKQLEQQAAAEGLDLPNFIVKHYMELVEKGVITLEEQACIYGKEVHEHCPVRAEISRRGKLDLSKWIKPKAKIFEEADETDSTFYRGTKL